ncbi:MAG: (2Fe-2S)-binding protein [Polyangiaceae bacterium]|nr:(2Fe-2S)-binding protein [Polyangiaceae bacterium]
MPTIKFEGKGSAAPKIAEAPEGGALLDICDKVLAPIAFSCRSASCGTCHIEVLEGAELLEDIDDDEEDLLDLLDGPSNSRLACQAEVKPGEGLIHIRALGS